MTGLPPNVLMNNFQGNHDLSSWHPLSLPHAHMQPHQSIPISPLLQQNIATVHHTALPGIVQQLLQKLPTAPGAQRGKLNVNGNSNGTSTDVNNPIGNATSFEALFSQLPNLHVQGILPHQQSVDAVNPQFTQTIPSAMPSQKQAEVQTLPTILNSIQLLLQQTFPNGADPAHAKNVNNGQLSNGAAPALPVYQQPSSQAHISAVTNALTSFIVANMTNNRQSTGQTHPTIPITDGLDQPAAGSVSESSPSGAFLSQPAVDTGVTTKLPSQESEEPREKPVPKDVTESTASAASPTTKMHPTNDDVKQHKHDKRRDRKRKKRTSSSTKQEAAKAKAISTLLERAKSRRSLKYEDIEWGRPGIDYTCHPCPARSVTAPDHYRTGVLRILKNVEHAQQLFCSHSACRAGGVRFLYCAFCEQPVAKVRRIL